MAESFEDLGIAPELVAGAEDMGWNAPSALQRDAIPVLRRGNNAVLRASTGAGVTGAWGLAVLDRLASFDDDASPLALVLTPSVDETSRAADALARIGAPAGVTVRALAPGWTDRPARILVATAPAAMAAVRDSSLKLDAVAILVLAGADRIQELGGWDAVETLTESVTGAGQRIVVTGAADRVLQEYLDRHVRKALSMPARPAEGGTPGTTGSVRYVVAIDTARLDALVALLPSAGGTEVAVICRNQDRAEDMAAGLAARGIAAEGVAADAPPTEPDAPRILVLPAAEADQRTTRASVVSCDVPFDADTLTALHSGGGTVIVTPSEVPHLRRIAARAALRLQPVALPDHHGADQAEAARAAIRKALGEADLAAYLSLLGPLLEEHPAAEIAAAALYLARSAGAAQVGGRADAGAAERGSGQLRSSGSGAPPPSTSYVRLFVSVGSRDDVNPGDLVGAITGEAGVAGETVGRIDIRESHSTVEVASADAARVIEALNGRTLKGRSVRVDYDRKDRPGSGGEGGGRSGPREGPGPQSRRRSGGGSRGGGPKGGPRGGKTGGKPAGRPGGRPSGRPSGGRSSGPGRGGSRK